MTINCYVFDLIQQQKNGTTWGHLGDDFCEVFYMVEDDTEVELKKARFAKCRAPNWPETMIVEERAWATLNN